MLDEINAFECICKISLRYIQHINKVETLFECLVCLISMLIIRSNLMSHHTAFSFWREMHFSYTDFDEHILFSRIHIFDE